MKTRILFLTWPVFLVASIWSHSVGGPVASFALALFYLASILFILAPKVIVGQLFSKKTTGHYILNWGLVVLSLAVANALGDAFLALLVSSVGAFIILFVKDISSLRDFSELIRLATKLVDRVENLEATVERLENTPQNIKLQRGATDESSVGDC